jgi:hypothetical protein
VEEMRLRSFDDYLMSLMGLVALVCIYMLYGARYFTSSSAPEIKVARIVEQIKTVKRKRDFYQSWVDVSPGDDLSPNDEIYTHGQSSAKITFTNGPEINLFENSLLRIKSLSKKNTLSLDRGNLTAKLSENSPKLDVMVNGKNYTFESKNANIQIEQGKTENKFVLLDGKAKLQIDQGTQELGANQVLIQNKKTGAVKIKELPFILKSPEQNFLRYYVKNYDVQFDWGYTKGAAPVKWTLARDSQFNDIVREENIDSNNFQMTFDKAGTYYWKLTSMDNLEGPIRSFTLKEEHPLLVSADKTILYKGPKKNESVYLNWSRDNVKNFEIKLKQPNGETTTVPLTKNSYELVASDLGNYEVSVRAKAENRPDALWSSPVTVEVVAAKEIPITSTTPDSIEKVNYHEGALTHLLTWNGPTSGVNYTVKLTKDGSTKAMETDNTSLPLKLETVGEYTWEVQGETPSGILTNKISGKISLKAPLKLAQMPSEGAVIELEKPDQTVSFKWDQVENSDYQFEISNDPNFQKILFDKEVKTNNVATTLNQTGRYFWRVKIKKGNQTEYSSPVSVEIRPTPPLARPEISPNIKIKVKYLEDKTSEFHLIDLFIAKAYAADPIAVAEWDLPANSRAKNYIVEIYEDQNLKKLITRIETSTPHVVWKNATAGTFYWRVSYEDYWGRKTEFSKVAVLESSIDSAYIKPEPIAEKLPPPPIELSSPKHRENILAEIEDSELFSWEKIPETKVYQLTVARDLEFEKPLLKTKVSSTEIKIHCKDVENTEGDYYWKISTEAGSTSKRRMFHASCAPKKIPEPVAAPTKPEPVLAKEAEKRSDHYFRVGLTPHQLTYDNKASQYTSKVSGTVLDSFFVSYRTPIDLKYFTKFDSTIGVSRGKVFQSFTFTDIDGKIRLHHEQSAFSWGPLIAFMKQTLYVEENLAITTSGQTSPLAGLFIEKPFERAVVSAEVKAGSAFNLHAEILFDIKKNITAGPYYDSTSLTKEGSKHTTNSVGLNVNYTFLIVQ